MIIGLGIGFVGLLAGLFSVGVVGLTIGIVVLFFVRKSRGEEQPLVTFSVPLFIKTFLYIIVAAAVIIASSGLADLLNAAFSPIDGKKFSYMPKEASVSALSGPLGLLQPKQDKPKADLNRELHRGLSDGVAKTVGAGLVAVILIMVLRVLETDEQRRGGVLNRAFWISLLAIFSVIAIVSLTVGLAKLLGYYLPDHAEVRVGPGGSLANAIVALLVWGYIIRRTVERLRAPAV